MNNTKYTELSNNRVHGKLSSQVIQTLMYMKDNESIVAIPSLLTDYTVFIVHNKKAKDFRDKHKGIVFDEDFSTLTKEQLEQFNNIKENINNEN